MILHTYVYNVFGHQKCAKHVYQKKNTLEIANLFFWFVIFFTFVGVGPPKDKNCLALHSSVLYLLMIWLISERPFIT